MAHDREKKPAWLKVGLGLLAMGFLTGIGLIGFSLRENARSMEANQALNQIVYEQQFWASQRLSARGLENDTAQQICTLDFTVIEQDCPDIVAWLSCTGNAINYSVVQTDNNDYYLNHLYDGNVNSRGSIFADYRNAPDFSDRNTVIYGHNIKNGTMFHSLMEYKDQEFYDACPVMTLYTPQGDYRVELFAGTVEDGNKEFVEFNFPDEKAFLDYISDLKARSTFQSSVEVGPEDRIITLCTCSYEQHEARYTVCGKLVPILA